MAVKTKPAKKAKTLKVSKEEAIELLTTLGHKGVSKWNDSRIMGRLLNIKKQMNDDGEFDGLDEDSDPSGDMLALATKLVTCIEERTVFELVDEAGDTLAVASYDEEPAAESEEPAVKKGKKAEKAEPKEKKERAKKEGPGVIDTIISCLQNASSKAPVTKKEILEKLKEEFPDREESGLNATIQAQVPTRLRAKKGLDIVRVGEHGSAGYYIKKAAKAKN